jgi:outer membrane receptor for ferrienterochelin and colicins
MPVVSASRPCKLVILATLAPAVMLAHAQQTDSATPLPQVDVKGASTAYDARRDDTAMKIVVGRQELARYGDSNVLEVLRRLPGITVTSTGRDTQVQMRGLGGGYTQVLVNGEHMPAGFSLDTLSPDLIERIEVLRAQTADYAAQGIAGTINIVLRRSVRKSRREAKLGYLVSSNSRARRQRSTWPNAATSPRIRWPPMPSTTACRVRASPWPRKRSRRPAPWSCGVSARCPRMAA